MSEAIGIERRISVTKALPVDLTKAERDEKWLQYASIVHKVNDLKAEAKAQAKHFKAKIEDLEITGSNVLHAAETGKETREVDCAELQNITTGRVVVVRLDTGEVVTRRSLRDDERAELEALRQETLPGVEATTETAAEEKKPKGKRSKKGDDKPADAPADAAPSAVEAVPPAPPAIEPDAPAIYLCVSRKEWDALASSSRDRLEAELTHAGIEGGAGALAWIIGDVFVEAGPIASNRVPSSLAELAEELGLDVITRPAEIASPTADEIPPDDHVDELPPEDAVSPVDPREHAATENEPAECRLELLTPKSNGWALIDSGPQTEMNKAFDEEVPGLHEGESLRLLDPAGTTIRTVNYVAPVAETKKKRGRAGTKAALEPAKSLEPTRANLRALLAQWKSADGKVRNGLAFEIDTMRAEIGERDHAEAVACDAMCTEVGYPLLEEEPVAPRASAKRVRCIELRVPENRWARVSIKMRSELLASLKTLRFEIAESGEQLVTVKRVKLEATGDLLRAFASAKEMGITLEPAEFETDAVMLSTTAGAQ